MKKYRLQSDNDSDQNLTKSNKYKFKNYDGEKIRNPEYLFNMPKAEKKVDIVSEDIEGKWKGTPIVKVAELRDNIVSPYNPDIDYQEEYKIINFNLFYDVLITPIVLRKYDWFNNNRITAFEELIQYVFNIEINKVSTDRYSLRLKSLFKKFTMQEFFSKHTKNHKVLDHYFGINYNEERRKLITDHLEGTELKIYDSEDMGIYLEKKGDFYVLEHNTPFPDEVVGDAGANCKLTYDQSKYTFVFQQIANSQLVLHGCWFEELTMHWSDLVIENNLNGTRQFRVALQRQKVEPKTHITVGGDYVEKKVDIRDSVINRSDI
ncbi:MAG TPA: hypothetical protein QGI59_03370 [Candidatus Poseidoniia archaeon]|nr:hypothetical protein [Candidatus Poseidoniia archaeon]